MLYVCEFEIVRRESVYIALPFGLFGYASGSSFQEVLFNASEWLHTLVLATHALGQKLEKVALRNAPRHDGMLVTLGVNISMFDVESVTISQAAKMLKMTTAHIARLCAQHKLVYWSIDAARFITVASINEYLKTTT